MLITDEMPDTWVRELVTAIEVYDHEVIDAHESAITIDLTPATMRALDADPGNRLIIGWTERAGIDWGLGESAAFVPHPEPLDAGTPQKIAARIHLLLTTGRTEPRPLRHAIPYAAVGATCKCRTVRPCGGIIPADNCPEHGPRRNPTMSWHWEENCERESE